jgi:hypothetical protein
MSAKRSLAVASIFALALLPLGAQPCRADEFEDQQFQQMRRRSGAAASELKREAADALAKARSLARDDPARALRLLHDPLARLRDDDRLPRAERRELISRLESCARELKGLVAANERPNAGQGKPPTEPGSRGAGASARPTPPVAGNGPSGRGSPSGGSGSPLGQTSVQLSTTVTVPDRGVAVAGGYNRVVEGRNEFGPPVLSRVPYVSRLFRNVGYGREVNGFRVLVGVRIFSLREEEERFLGQAPSP